jgi:hypothetical protein
MLRAYPSKSVLNGSHFTYLGIDKRTSLSHKIINYQSEKFYGKGPDYSIERFL